MGHGFKNTMQLELLGCLHAASSVMGSALSSIHSNCKKECDKRSNILSVYNVQEPWVFN